MKTLGLNVSGYISSAALVEDGRIVAAACEERLSRHKRDRAFPRKAINFVLSRGSLKLTDLDEVVIAWNPSRNLGRNHNMLTESNANRAKYLAYVPNALASGFGLTPEDETSQALSGVKVRYLDHHLCHAASACYTSPWDRCAFVTLDAFGEEDSLTIGRFKDNSFEVLDSVRYPHSIGSFYSYFTEFLGFQGDSDEYKVMALGAYSRPELARPLEELVAKTYELEVRDGHLVFQMDLRLFDFYLFHRNHDFSPLAAALGMEPRRPGSPVEDIHFALARAIQVHFEKMMDLILSHARTLTGETRVALSGGCFMNSLANGKLECEDRIFDSYHIPPYPDDSGTAIGAALYPSFHKGVGVHEYCRHNFFGPEIDLKEAEELLRHRKIPFTRVEDVGETVARLVAAGEIVGYAEGPMEFGQRALGHRSIFADPRNPRVRDLVNDNIKHREWFRPYAASVLADRVSEVFQTPQDFKAYFMEKVRLVQPAWSDRISGLLHADGTVRLHTIDQETNPRLFRILAAFDRLTGVPLILNTSFNVAGMPIVCSVEDALGCFYACGLDSLLVGNLLIRKSL